MIFENLEIPLVVRIIKMIFRRGDFNIPTSTGWTPLMLAITQNNFESSSKKFSKIYLN